MKVAIEEIKEIQARRQEINQMNLEDITFTENGEPVDIPEDLITAFRYTGLCNVDFITSEYYKGVE